MVTEEPTYTCHGNGPKSNEKTGSSRLEGCGCGSGREEELTFRPLLFRTYSFISGSVIKSRESEK